MVHLPQNAHSQLDAPHGCHANNCSDRSDANDDWQYCWQQRRECGIADEPGDEMATCGSDDASDCNCGHADAGDQMYAAHAGNRLGAGDSVDAGDCSLEKMRVIAVMQLMEMMLATTMMLCLQVLELQGCLFAVILKHRFLTPHGHHYKSQVTPFLCIWAWLGLTGSLFQESKRFSWVIRHKTPT